MTTKTDAEILDWLNKNEFDVLKQLFGIIIKYPKTSKIVLNGDCYTDFKVMWGYDLIDAVTRILNDSN